MKKYIKYFIFIFICFITFNSNVFAIGQVDSLPQYPLDNVIDYEYEYDNDIINVTWLNNNTIRFCVNNDCTSKVLNVNRFSVIWLVAKYSNGYELGITDISLDSSHYGYWYTDGQHSTSSSCSSNPDYCYLIDDDYIFYRYYVYSSGMYSMYSTLFYSNGSFGEKSSSLYWNDNIYILGSNVPVIFVDNWPPNTNNIEALSNYIWYDLNIRPAHNIIFSTTDDIYSYTSDSSLSHYDESFVNFKDIVITINDLFLSSDYKVTYNYVDSLGFTYSGIISSNNYHFHAINNGTLSVNILDSNNNIVDSLSKSYSDIQSLSVRGSYDSNGNGSNLYSLNVNYHFSNYNRSNFIPFRLQFFSNDFSDDFVPRLLGYESYYYTNNNSKHLAKSLVSIHDFKCITISNNKYCTGYILTDPLITNFEVDFIFNHVENYSLYYYDKFFNDFSDRTISVLSNDLIGYTKYRFPDNSDKAYIYKKHSDQNILTGNVVFPWYYVINDSIDIKSLYYDSREYLSYDSYINSYYKKFSFDLSNHNVLVVTLNRPNVCSIKNSSDFPLFQDVDCNYDGAYIFVSNDFIVSFNSFPDSLIGSNSHILVDDDGNIVDTISDDFNNDNFYINSSFSDSFLESISFFSAPISYIISTFTTIWNGLPDILRYFFVSIFVFLLGVFILKFIL